jgi:predicted ATPase
LLQGQLQTAHELAEELMRLARNVQNPTLLLEAHRVLGDVLFWMGEVAPARAHLEQGISLYDPQQHRSLAFLYGIDPGVLCHSSAALTLWFLGYPEQALQRSHEALTLAQEASHPYSLAVALGFTTELHQCRRERQTAQERAEVMISLASEQGFAFFLAEGTILQGWTLAMQGQGEEGIVQMRQSLAAWRAMGTELIRPYFLTLLAEAYGKVGQTEEGLAVLAEALAAVHKTEERVYEAELYRLKGELLRMGEREEGGKGEEISRSPTRPFAPSSPEACFLKAIEIARKQSAKSLELRAVMSLGRLWQSQGKKEEARRLVHRGV